MTASDLERAHLPEGLWEVIDGELVEVAPSGRRQTRIVVNLVYALSTHVRPRRLGDVLIPDCGIVLAEYPLTLRSPDSGFIRAGRLSADDMDYFRVVPDLVVEVVSPSDRASEVIAKALLWLDAGATIVWSVDPASQTITIYKTGQTLRLLTVDDTLSGDEVLPGFTLPVRDLFAV